MLTSRSTTARRSILGLILLAVIAGSIFGAWFSAQRSASIIRQQLENRAKTVAYLLDASDVVNLTGQESDMQMAYYQRLKTTLAHVKQANSDIRSVYITVEQGDKLYFYADSEKPDSQYYSPPGEYYPDATPLFKNLFKQDTAAVEGPSKDEFGTWVSGLAPIRDPETGAIIAVLGLDIGATYYYQSLALAAAIPVILGFLVIGMIFAYEWQRRRDIENLRLQSELVSVASHELRSPLTGILWATESLQALLSGDNRKAADRIYSSAARLQTVVEDILQLSRLSGQKHRRLTVSECNLSQLVKEVCAIQQLVAAQKPAELVITESLNKPVTVQCDSDAMKRALHNVISNAIKYTRPHTSVTISYTRTEKMHTITVQDQGIGIPAAEQKQVFNGLYRASNARANGIDGTGMGLFLVRSIMEQHGGTVSLDSTQDIGTTITISLPFV